MILLIMMMTSRMHTHFFPSLSLSLLQLILYSLIVIDAFYSVDDLKVFTEDELMDMALKQVFEVRSSDFSPFFFSIVLYFFNLFYYFTLQGRENNENYPPLLNQPNAGSVTVFSFFFCFYSYVRIILRGNLVALVPQ